MGVIQAYVIVTSGRGACLLQCTILNTTLLPNAQPQRRAFTNGYLNLTEAGQNPTF